MMNHTNKDDKEGYNDAKNQYIQGKINDPECIHIVDIPKIIKIMTPWDSCYKNT